MAGADDEDDDLETEVSKNEIAVTPNEVADPQWIQSYAIDPEPWSGTRQRWKYRKK
jgi:hypothetical protein